jgi:hemerythrin
MITQDQLPMVAMPNMNDMHLEDMILINKLSNAAKNKDFDLSKNTLDELIAHTIVHFSGEEEMMEEKKFSDYAPHKKEHDRVLTELKSIAKNFAQNDGDFLLITAYVDGSLAPWMLHHVQTLDIPTAMFLKNEAS